ncbi:MAG TPA: ferredoxin [Candidatus Paceibacterota bacterium]|nr:ferredoxin [Candidatus Paceibacterota bacterium]
MFKVRVDESKCIGCGACEAICDKVFVLKDGKAKVKKSNSEEKCVKEAKDSCPVNAISVEKA